MNNLHEIKKALQEISNGQKTNEETENEMPGNIDFSKIEASGDAAQTFVNLLAVMNYLGRVGASRDIVVSFDGDGVDRIEVPGLETDEEFKKALEEVVDSGKSIRVSYNGVDAVDSNE